MEILISFPPLENEKGCPCLGQNRQFQWFSEPTYIYPMVPASAATLLKKNGCEVIWNDCISEKWAYKRFLDFYQKESADIIAIETKTPVVKMHWKIIEDLKRINPDCKIVLMGDHVTALPQESMKESKVDFVLTGGDYDFMLLNLVGHLKFKNPLKPGFWYRENSEIKNTGKFVLDGNLNNLPLIDRELTNWRLYSEKNGNFKKTPGTYIMAGRDCWYHNCTFCSWRMIYPEFRVRKPEKLLDEIGILIEKYKIVEIMDDTGTFPVGDWLREFCQGMINRGYSKKVSLDCNMRFGALSYEDYRLMKKAGFRFLLFGLESANQDTLDRIKKNLKVEEIIESCKLARKAGLYPHITIMFGYHWETYEDALGTLKLGKYLLKKGYAYTMQATIVISYPGTPMFEECKNRNLLTTLDWSRYDMKESVMKISFDKEKLMKLIQKMYGVSFNPEFIFRKISSIRNKEDLSYFFRAAKKVVGHLLDFKSTS